MELIYTVSSSVKKEFLFENYAFLVSLSSKNVLAFCTSVEIAKRKNWKKVLPKSIADTEYYIYVCDIDKPWYANKLTSTHNKIVSLEWHPLGLKLFYADVAGNCYIYQMKYLLDSWEVAAHACIGREDILSAMWLNQGLKVNFHVEKKDSTSYSEKFREETNYNPMFSICEQVDGVLLLTSSCLALLALPDDPASEEMSIILADYPLVGQLRSVADIWVDRDKFLIVSSDGLLSSTVQCHSVVVGYESDKPVLKCEPTHSFFIDHPKQNCSCCTSEIPTSECFCHREVIFLKFLSNDSILVSYNINGCGHVELWRLVSEPIVLHEFFMKHLPADFQPLESKRQKWSKVAALSHNSHVTSIAIPQLPVVPNIQHSNQLLDVGFENSELRYVAVAYKDGSAKLVNRSTFVLMATTHLDTGNINEKWECPERRTKTLTPHFTHMQQSFTGCILIGIDQNSCIYVMKAINTRDPVTQVSPVVLVSLCEYLIYTARDFWDVMAAVKPGTAEVIQLKLRENFKKQPAYIQEMHFNRFLSLNSLLYRSLNNAIRTGENYCRSMVFLLNGYFKSIMVSRFSSNDIQFSVERFTQACKNFDCEIENLLMNLPTDKKFVGDNLVYGNLQYLLTWCHSLAKYLVCIALPCTTAYGRSYHRCNSIQVGCGLVSDVGVMRAVRELVVIVKLWMNAIAHPRDFHSASNAQTGQGNGNGASTPDKLSQLFRLITKMYLNAHESKEADESFVEECLTFAEMNPKFIMPKPGDGLTFDLEVLFGSSHKEVSSMFLQSLPLSFTFLKSPSYETVKSKVRSDCVRHFLIAPSRSSKTCSRCDGISLIKDDTNKSIPLSSWENNFERTCCCGGLWRSTVR